MAARIIGILLAISLLVPSLTEAHSANPWVAGLITPIILTTGFVVGSIGGVFPTWENNLLFGAYITIPGFGHFYSRDAKGGWLCVLAWSIGQVSFLVGGIFCLYGPEGLGQILAWSGISLMAISDIVDIIHAPVAAKRHNEKHARDKAESSRITFYPALALGRNYVGAGIGVCF